MSRGLLETAKITGPGAASAKYDVLTALLALATQGEGVEARLALRLSLLITARYNWRRGSFAVGQKELARMWGVTERTVKREMAELRGRGWIVVDVPAARGRVAQYRIDFDTVLLASEPFWEAVGVDFAGRMNSPERPDEEVRSNVISVGFVRSNEPLNSKWGSLCATVQAQDPKLYQSWLSKLQFSGFDDGKLMLLAPSRFLANYITNELGDRLLRYAKETDSSIESISVRSSD